MKRLIDENNDVILDGTATRAEKEKEAFEKLGAIEDILSKYDIESLDELDYYLYICIGNIAKGGK